MRQLPDKILEIEAAMERAEQDGRHRLALEESQEWVEVAIAELCSRAVPPVETQQCETANELLSTIETALDVRAGTHMETAHLQAAHVLTVGLIDYNLRRISATQMEDASEGVAALVRAGEVLGRLRGWVVSVLLGIVDYAAESERLLYLQTVVAPTKAAATKTQWVRPAIFGFEAYKILKQPGEHDAIPEAYNFAIAEGTKPPKGSTMLPNYLKDSRYESAATAAKAAISKCVSSNDKVIGDDDLALAFRALEFMREKLQASRSRMSHKGHR